MGVIVNLTYMKEFIPCRNCVGIHNKRPDVPLGYRPNFEGDSIDGQVKSLYECTCHWQWRITNELEQKLKLHGFNPAALGYDIKTYKGTKSIDNVMRLKKFTTVWDNKDRVWGTYGGPVVLYMYGPYGTQKTTLANWAGKEILSKGYKADFVLMNDLVKLLQKVDSFNRDDLIEQKLRRLEETDFLFIDESFDREKMTVYKSGYQIPFLDSFLRKRLISGCAVIFISNVHPNDINLSPAIKDLIVRTVHKQNTLLQFEDNYEAQMNDYDVVQGLF